MLTLQLPNKKTPISILLHFQQNRQIKFPPLFPAIQQYNSDFSEHTANGVVHSVQKAVICDGYHVVLPSPTNVECCPSTCMLRICFFLSTCADKGGSQITVARDQSSQDCLSRPRPTHCFYSGSGTGDIAHSHHSHCYCHCITSNVAGLLACLLLKRNFKVLLLLLYPVLHLISQ